MNLWLDDFQLTNLLCKWLISESGLAHLICDVGTSLNGIQQNWVDLG